MIFTAIPAAVDFMRHSAINLHETVILVADPSAYLRKIVVSILRGFGTKSLLEVDSAAGLMRAMNGQRIDVLLCDSRLPDQDGFAATVTIRRDPVSPYRTIPILIMTSDTRETSIRQARDSGANMVIAKPLSPRALYDRLAWVALNSRPFVDCDNYFGPDRRYKIEGYPGGVGRRRGDKPIEVAQETGPALEQDDIDNLFNAARVGLAQ
ncbi:MAG: response regulator [Xanthobacteraceae bacterium]|nr:response regulator [Xanthobacteraceae bacterium]QYK44168.1 MAG: response regulator [Xanthobacteraceae bacterium]